MVKNTKGGSGHKSQASKHNAPASASVKLRLSEDPLEQYAFIVKRLGGEFCHVKCQDGRTRLCVIRGKFRGGRGKKDSFINNDSWVLIGIRDWETKNENSDKLEKCDLLEVYRETDKMKLKMVPGVNWMSFIANDNSTSSSSSSSKIVEEDIIFSNDVSNDEYDRLISANKAKISSSLSVESTTNPLEEIVEEDEINIDDI